MAQLRHVTTRSTGPAAHMSGISDLAVVEGDAGPRLVSAGAAQGGVLVQDPGAGLAIRDTGHYARPGGLDAPRALVPVQIDGAPVLLAPGRYGTDIEAFRLDGAGNVASRFALDMRGGAPGAVLALEVAAAGGREWYVTASRQAPGLSVWQREGDALRPVAQGIEAGLADANDVLALASLTLGGQARVLALSAQGHHLTAYALTAQGRLTAPQRLDLRDGLYLDTPTRLVLTEVAGQAYALIGAAGSGSIAVVALAADGTMRVTDQVNDDAGTRFAGLGVLQAATVNGQVYVVAGGTDDGLSLMTLLPGGRLLHLHTLADDGRMALQDPAALALAVRGGGLDVFVAGALPQGSPAGTGAAEGVSGALAQFRVDLGAIGDTVRLGAGRQRHDGGPGRDQIVAGPDGDVLEGGAGDDILMDGAGTDLLRGGPGADVFVMTRDGQTDRILDFELGIDRLDLSAMGRFYSLDAVDIRATSRGFDIRLGGERLRVDTADGRALEAGDFTIADLRDLWHIDIAPPPEAPLSLSLTGSGGADLLDGRAGDDTLRAEAWDAEFDPVSGQIYRLYRATLDRAPDAAGLHYWAEALLDGSRGLGAVAAGFAGSAEFRKTYGATDDAGFVTLLYANVLDRAPDAAGLGYWTGLLASGARSRADVVIGFSESREFVAATQAASLAYERAGLQAGHSGEVYRLYRATLGREPDAAGFLDWTARLAGGLDFGTIVSGFVGSREFARTYGDTDDRQFVTLLYENVLGRAPDARGLADWLARLGPQGWSRETSVEAFANSREFIRDSAPDLTAWMRGRGLDDVLDGGGGKNLLMGGVGADCFVFRAADNGHHVVADLEPWDMLRFEGFDYGNADDLRAHLSQAGADTIFADQGVRVAFLGTHLGEITDAMFDW